MPDILTVERAIMGRFIEEWADRIPVELENEPEGAELQNAKAAGTPWVRVVFRPGDGNQIEVGQPKVARHIGMIIISAFAKRVSDTAQQGRTDEALDYANQAAEVFVGENFDSIICRAASFTKALPSNGWSQVNASILTQWTKTPE